VWEEMVMGAAAGRWSQCADYIRIYPNLAVNVSFSSNFYLNMGIGYGYNSPQTNSGNPKIYRARKYRLYGVSVIRELTVGGSCVADRTTIIWVIYRTRTITIRIWEMGNMGLAIRP
jgi:hypothetical protein